MWLHWLITTEMGWLVWAGLGWSVLTNGKRPNNRFVYIKWKASFSVWNPLKVSWRDPIFKEFFGNLPPIVTSLRCFGCSFFSSHCWRSKWNETVSQLLILEPKHDRRSRDRPATAFLDQIESCNTGHIRQEPPSVMANRREWDRSDLSYRCKCARQGRWNPSLSYL